MPEMTDEDEQNFVNNNLSDPERDAIDLALASTSPWSHENFPNPTKASLKSAKNKIKLYHLARTSNRCCYCRRSLLDANIETDREHIIPKGSFRALTYSLFNLSVACKRCNMSYKKERLDHIVDHNTIEADIKNPDRYLIPHPNIDLYSDHIVRTSFQYEDGEITTYKLITDKGKFLYEFVRLDKLCIDGIDRAQGGKGISEALAELLKLPIEGA